MEKDIIEKLNLECEKIVQSSKIYDVVDADVMLKIEQAQERAIQESKKEVSDDAWNLSVDFMDWYQDEVVKKDYVNLVEFKMKIKEMIYDKLKKRHLSTFQKEKRHNSDFKAHKSSPKDCPIVHCYFNNKPECKADSKPEGCPVKWGNPS